MGPSLMRIKDAVSEYKPVGDVPLQYLARLKVAAAPVFLVDTNLKIGAGADRFGFGNPFHFSRLFKNVPAFTPEIPAGLYCEIFGLIPRRLVLDSSL